MTTPPFPTFDEFFQIISEGFRPYLWQNELAEQATAGEWPDQIEVPTGLGKTGSIVAAVYALARQVQLGNTRTHPQRIFHVVDRKNIVDQTGHLIRAMAKRINEAVTSEPLWPVRRALAALCGDGDTVPVETATIHSESERGLSWLRATGCVVVSCTTHQFVSRLLMRGYGVSTGTRPIHAGLTGIDSLVLLDEPHLSTPAISTIRDVIRLQASAETPLPLPPLHLTLVGATIPPNSEAADAVSDREPRVLRCNPATESQANAEAARRFGAIKPLHLIESRSVSDSAYAKTMVTAARAAIGGGHTRVAVVCNTVALAQQVFTELQSEPLRLPARLLTSRFRSYERTELGATPPGITVSTQVIEVGADLNFDTLITEAAPWQSLVQRFGRLNRDGHLLDSSAVMVHSVDSHRKSTGFVYNSDSITEAVAALCQERDTNVSQGHSPELDVSTQGIERIQARHPELAHYPRPRVATLHSALIPALTSTRPAPKPDIKVEAFISGPDHKNVGEVSVAWRSHPLETTAASPLPGEFVSVPLGTLRSLLQTDRRNDTDLADTDTPAERAPKRGHWNAALLGRVAIYDREVRSWKALKDHTQIQPNTKIVLPSMWGGYSSALGWHPPTVEHVADLSTLVWIKHLMAAPDHLLAIGRRGIQTIPITRESLGSYIERSGMADLEKANRVVSEFNAVLEKLQQGRPEELFADDPSFHARIEDLTEELIELSGLATHWSSEETRPDDCGAWGILLRVSSRKQDALGIGPMVDSPSLTVHQQQVSDFAHSDGSRAGLSPELCEEVGLAAVLHDEGKRIEEFQTLLGWDGSSGEPLLAKSRHATGDDTASDDPAARRARVKSGVPEGWRHEAWSVLCAQERGASILVLHLIGAHHGHFRPGFRVLPGAHAQTVLAVSHADDFATLNRRFGPWGLAYLETLLRLADWRASRESYTAHFMEISDRDTLNSAALLTRSEQADLIFADATKHLEPTQEFIFTGLHGSPILGWYSAMGLLRAASLAGDTHARLRWGDLEGHRLVDPSLPPAIPVLSTSLDLASLIHSVHDHPWWREAVDLLKEHGLTSLTAKSQKVSPAALLRHLLHEADRRDNQLLVGLINDQVAASDKDAIAMPLVARANNSSFPGVALSFLEVGIEEVTRALTDSSSGWSRTQCDGGLDRHETYSPANNGLGDPETRWSRSHLAPLALFGMTSLGALGSDGLGVAWVSQHRELRLPAPASPASFEELRDGAHRIWTPSALHFAKDGWSWVLLGKLIDRGDSVKFWSSHFVELRGVSHQEQLR